MSLKSELKDYKKLITLLCKGKGSLSDYLLVASSIGLGVLLGCII